MKRYATTPFGLLPFIASLTALTLPPAIAHGQCHEIYTTVWLSVPNGDSAPPRAHIGDKVDVHIRVWNLDECMDTVTVNSVVVLIHHRSGDVTIPNLAPDGVVIRPEDVFADFTSSFLVAPDDGDYVSVECTTRLTDNWDGIFRGIPVGFSNVLSDYVRILKPAVKVFQQCEVSPAYPVVVFTGVVTNTGNTSLSNVVVVADNATPGNGADDSTICIGTLDPNSSAPYTGTCIATGLPSTITVKMHGTDALGLAVTESSTNTITLALKIVRSGPDVTVRWPGWAKSFRLESCDGVGQNWKEVTHGPIVGNGECSVTLGISTNQFYRLAWP